MAFGLFKKKIYADTVLLDGKILTLDPETEDSTCLAIKDGKILFIGQAEEIQELIGPDTKKIELDGSFVSPGLIEILDNPGDYSLSDLFIFVNNQDDVFHINEKVADYYSKHKDAEYLLIFGISARIFENQKEGTEDDFSTMLGSISDTIPVIAICEDGISMRLNNIALGQLKPIAEEYGLEVLTPEFVIDTLVSIDYDLISKNFCQKAFEYAKHGTTSSFGASRCQFFESLYKDVLTNLYGTGKIKQRYFGGMPLRTNIPPRAVLHTLNKNKTNCTELNGYINYNCLSVLVGNKTTPFYFSEDYLKDVLTEAKDNGYSIRVKALDKESAIAAYNILGKLSNNNPKQSFVLLHDCLFSETELAEIFTGDVIDIQLDGFGRLMLEPAGEDALLFYTDTASAVLGAPFIGRIAEGAAADLAIFKENPIETQNSAAFKALNTQYTILGGEIVYQEGDTEEKFKEELIPEEYAEESSEDIN